MSWSLHDIVSDEITNLLHPEFGSIYREPDGEAYLAYQAGLTEGRAESTRRKTMSESTTKNPPAEGVAFAVNYDAVDGIPPMSKVELGVILGFVGIVITAVGFGIKHDIKLQEQRAREYKAEREERDAKAEASRKARTAWFDKQRTNGMRIIETRDGRYIAISNEAYANAEVKKKGEWL